MRDRLHRQLQALRKYKRAHNCWPKKATAEFNKLRRETRKLRKGLTDRGVISSKAKDPILDPSR